MTIREGRWDCQYCGTKGVLGRYKACPVCASGRPEGVKFYLPEDANAVDDAEQLGYARLGPDWICEFCGSSNAANHVTCQSCFAKRTATAPSQLSVAYHTKEIPRSGDMTLDQPGVVEKKSATPESDQGNKPRRRVSPVIIISGLVLFIVCGAFAFWIGSGLISQDVVVTVSGLEWQRSISVEEQRTVVEQDWSVPPEGRLISQTDEIHHYNQVLTGSETRSREVPEQVYVGERSYVCGSRDLGNGFFEDVMCSESIYETRYRTEFYEEPVYDQVAVYQPFYTYEIDRWVVAYTESADGRNREPYWPRVTLEDDQRIGEREAFYWVFFQDSSGEIYRLELPENDWGLLIEGNRHMIKTNHEGNVVEIIE